MSYNRWGQICKLSLLPHFLLSVGCKLFLVILLTKCIRLTHIFCPFQMQSVMVSCLTYGNGIGGGGGEVKELDREGGGGEVSGAKCIAEGRV